jgi:glucose/arabinose dehydrogenase
VLLLPPESDPSGLAAVHATDSHFSGDLIVSTRGGEDLLRVRIAEDGTPRLRARLLQRRFGRVAQVAAGPDGSLYFVTDNENEWGPGQELLVRVEGRE